MPRIVVRKSYRCQPGKRREVLTALQRMDAAVAEAGYPRGRYVFAETRSPGEPDLEVEFTFESYGEMERLERAMRERVVRYLREGGATGQEYLLEPSATKHLLLVEGQVPASAAAREGAGAVSGQSRGDAAPRQRAQSAPAAPSEPLDLTLDEDDDEEFEEPPEPDMPPPPEIPAGMTPADFQRAQVERAKAALQNAERTVGQTPRRPSGQSRA